MKSNNTPQKITADNLLKEIIAELKEHSPHYISEAHILVLHGLGISQEKLLQNPELQVSPKKYSAIKKYAEQRKKSVPIAYICKTKEFYSRDFFVDKNVLIPRPETEQIIDRVLKIIDTTYTQRPANILDCGTGSGCIGITIAAECAKRNLPCSVSLSDVSEKALTSAKKNARTILGATNAQNLNFYRADVLEILDDYDTKKSKRAKEQTREQKSFGIIIANFPYIAPQHYKFLHPSLQYEPQNALREPFYNYFLQKMFSEINLYIADTQDLYVILEIDPLQLDSVLRLGAHYGYENIEIYNDLRGHARICCLEKKPCT